MSSYNKLLSSLVCVLLLCKVVHAENIINSSSAQNAIETKIEGDGSLIIELSLTKIDTASLIINGQNYYKITIPEGHSPLHKGMPDLPVYTKSFIIPDNSFISVQTVEESYQDYDLKIAPSKGSISRNNNWDSVPYTFSDIYRSDIFYPTDIINTSDPYLIRDVQGCTIEICPFKYNAVSEKLRIYKYLKIQISFLEKSEREPSIYQNKQVDQHFKPILQHLFVNYDYCFNNLLNQNEEQNCSERTLNETAAKMLVICCDTFVTEMRNFVIHKNNLGLPTTLVKMSDVGTTADNVKTFIQNTYDNDNDLTYVLLVGDSQHIPSPIRQYFVDIIYGDSVFIPGASDPLYSLVSGNDNIPDIIIGRFSAETKQDVKTMVDRVILYENEIESDWFHKGIGIASNEQSATINAHGYYESDWQHMRNIRTKLLLGHYYNVEELYDGSHGLMDAPGNPSATTIINSINGGISLVNYIGHGDYNKWETGNFQNYHVNLLNNVSKLPFVYSVACNVGAFNNNSLCFAEKWQRARQQSTNYPTGCIGFYGSSILQSWDEPMDAQDSFNEQLINEDYLSIGSLCYSSSCDMMNNYVTGDAHYNAIKTFNTWILFGDPSLHIVPNNNIGKTIFIEGNVNNDSIYVKEFVDVHNAVITNDADVIIDHEESTIFTGPFTIEVGSTLFVE